MIRSLQIGVLLLGCIFNLAALADPSETAVPAHYQEVSLVHPLEAPVPAELRNLPIENPRVVYRVVVDAKGEILDSLAIETNHYGLLEAGEKTLAKARFEPALLDGKPVSGKITVMVTFYDPEQRVWRMGGMTAPMGGTIADAVESRMYLVSKESFVYGESKVTELDTPLQIIEAKLSMIHPDDEPMPTGDVLVQYYVDHKGRVRLPEILQSDHQYLSMSVLVSLKDTVFQPPLRSGHPTYVRVRQPFQFD